MTLFLKIKIEHISLDENSEHLHHLFLLRDQFDV